MNSPAIQGYLQDRHREQVSGLAVECSALNRDFGGVRAVSDFRIIVQAGEIHGLIGPNGAGKSTVLNLFSGLIPPTSGNISYFGSPLRGSMTNRARRGLVRTFQKGRLFSTMTVVENIAAAIGPHHGRRLLSNIIPNAAVRHSEDEVRRVADELVNLFGLQDVRDVEASSLSPGRRRLVEIARALAAAPRVLMLDEPAAGLNSVERQHLINLIRKLRDEFRITVILIEHDIALVTQLCDRITVMHQGSVISTGSPAEIISDQRVQDAYLGSRRGRGDNDA